MTRKFTALLILYISSRACRGEECDCNPVHPQTALCNAEFAFIGRIDSVTSGQSPDDPGTTVYFVEVLVCLKGNIGNPGDIVLLTTPNDPVLCGIKGLGPVRHIFSGVFLPNSINSILQCRDFVKPISDITLEQWMFLLQGCKPGWYLSNCNCEIETESNNPTPVPGCKIPDNSSVSCYFDTALCYRRQYEFQCKWSVNKCV